MTAWWAEPAPGPGDRAALEALVATVCAGSVTEAHLYAKVDADGRVSLRGDDLAETSLAACVWDPLLRPSRPAGEEIGITVRFATEPVTAIPEPGLRPAAAPEGMRCTARTRPTCAPGATCPEYVWTAAPCAQ